MLQTDLVVGDDAAGGPGTAWPRSTFSIVGPDSADRHRLEARIRSGFGTHFGACIDGFMPRFVLYRHTSGATGVIGYRRASDDPLYLEHYLELPVDELISVAAGMRVERSTIAEVGQFVVDDRDIAAPFFRDLVPFLVGQGFDWVCFTGTNRIRSILKRIGFRGLPVALADAGRIADRASWGSYYDNEPVVIVGKLDDPTGNWCYGEPEPRVAAADV